MDSEVETDRNESAESTVEEKSPDIQRVVPLEKRRRKDNTISNRSKMKKSNHGSNELIHPHVGKLPNRTTFTQYDANSEEVFCLCRKPDTGELMVACDGCDEWYHFKCVKIDKKYQKLVLSYYCPYCELNEKGNTIWKRRCRLASCFNPIAGNESKYCSKEHGLQFMNGVMDKALYNEDDEDTLLNQETVIQIINTVSNFEQFKQLGNTLPIAPIDLDSNPKVLKIKDILQSLNNDRNEKIQRKKLLIRTRENIKSINDLLTLEFDSETSTNKSSKKSKSKKIEICGYDPIFRKIQLDENDLKEENLLSNDSELLKKKFIELRNEENIELNENEICLLEKKKCPKHNGWQAMINDEIDLNIGKIDYKINDNEERIQKIKKVLTINYFEKSGNVS